MENPKSSILIGFGTIIFTMHFGGVFPPLFLVQHPYNDLYYPEVLVSDNYYKRQWRLSSVRRLRNVICFLEWATWWLKNSGVNRESVFWEKGPFCHPRNLTWIHPQKLTWNLKLMVSNRDLLFQGSVFRCHVSFLGCTKNGHFLGSRYRYRLSKAHHFGALQPFNFRGCGPFCNGEDIPLKIAFQSFTLESYTPGCKYIYIYIWVVVSNIFSFSPLPGEMIQFY